MYFPIIINSLSTGCLYSALLGASRRWARCTRGSSCAAAHTVCGSPVPSNALFMLETEISASLSRLDLHIPPSSVTVADLILTSAAGGCLRITPAIGVITLELASLNAIAVGGALSLGLGLRMVSGLVIYCRCIHLRSSSSPPEPVLLLWSQCLRMPHR